MNTKQLLERLTANWPTKIICFVIALLIYFFHQMSVLQRKVITVPLAITANGKMTPASESDRFIKVTIRGKSEEIATISVNDLKAYLDITNETKEGTYTYPVLVEPSQRLAFIEPLEIKVTPEKLSLAIEERISRYVPIAPVLSGICGQGYEAAKVVSVPTTIKVEGPRSMVESLTQIQTEDVNIDGITQNTVQQVYPLNENKLIIIDEKTPLSISVSVQETHGAKEIADVEVEYKNLADRFEVTSAVTKLLVTVEGSSLSINSFTDKQISAFADCSKITVPGIYAVPVSVIVPEGIKVTSQSTDTLAITVVERKSQNHSEKNNDESLNTVHPDVSDIQLYTD